MDGFIKASELGPGLSQEEEHQAQIKYLLDINLKLNEALDAKPQESGSMKPQEKESLVIIIDELQTRMKLCEQTIAKQESTIKDLKKEASEATQAIVEIREHFPAMIVDVKKRVKEVADSIIPSEKPTGKTDTQRVQKLIRYMNARVDRKASFETLRGYFQIKTNQLTALIRAADKLDPGRFTIKVDPHDKRKRWLMIKR